MAQAPDHSTVSLSDVHGSVAIPKNVGMVKRLFAFSGPAYLVSVGYMDPGNWVATRTAFALALILAAPVSAAASLQSGNDRNESDKSSYTLFSSTPSDLMRELNADRPDKTDCPFTVDAGHLQVEMDFINLTYNRPSLPRGNVRSVAIEIAPMNVKVGLLNSLDLQLVYTPYDWERTDDLNIGTAERRSGFEGITPRLKVNLVGNDGGFLAVALIPFVSLPLHQVQRNNGSIEGGLGIPYSFDVPEWDVGFQTSFNFNRNDAGSSYHTEIDNSVSIGHSLIGNLSIAAEFFSSVTTQKNSGWIGTFDTWSTYRVNQNLILDGGVYIGLTPAADDWHPWIGMTRRI